MPVCPDSMSSLIVMVANSSCSGVGRGSCDCRLVTADGDRSDRIGVKSSTADFLDHAPAPHHEYAVAQPDEFLVVGGHDQHRGAGRGGLVDELVDVGLGAHVDPLGRL